MSAWIPYHKALFSTRTRVIRLSELLKAVERAQETSSRDHLVWYNNFIPHISHNGSYIHCYLQRKVHPFPALQTEQTKSFSKLQEGWHLTDFPTGIHVQEPLPGDLVWWESNEISSWMWFDMGQQKCASLEAEIYKQINNPWVRWHGNVGISWYSLLLTALPLSLNREFRQ